MESEYARHIIDIIGKDENEKFIIIGGIHGNEKSGIDAIINVLPDLKKHSLVEKGKIYFLKGNLPALEHNDRFIEKDLNRLWLDENIFSENNSSPDFIQLKELYHLIADEICQNKFDNCYFLDLHTFSAKSGVFCIPAANAKSVAFAKSFSIPFIEKLSDTLPGTALSYFGNKGMTALVFEGGTHNTPEATRTLEAGIWHSLAYAGFISSELEKVKKGRELLKEISDNYPHHLELVYRHKLEDYYNFRMNKGYFNFKPIKKSEFLAVQNNSKITSPYSGYILMPLYQRKGSDGFFIVREKEEVAE